MAGKLTEAQRRALEALREHGPINRHPVSTGWGQAAHTGCREIIRWGVANSLRKKGLAEIRNMSQGRAAELRLTEAGQQAAARNAVQ